MTKKGHEELEELAGYYEKHAGDLSLWSTKPRKIRVRRGGPSHTFSIRFTPEEMELLDDAAGQREITITELIRTAALTSAREGEDQTLREVKERALQLAEAVKRLA
jgi:hypothetical protein